MKLNLDFSLYKGVTKLKQWYKEVKTHFTQVQEVHNALEDTVEAESEKLSTEITQRTNADVALSNRITTEANTRSSADAALGQRIDAEVTDRQTAIANEADTRQTADVTINQRIDNLALGGNRNRLLDLEALESPNNGFDLVTDSNGNKYLRYSDLTLHNTNTCTITLANFDKPPKYPSDMVFEVGFAYTHSIDSSANCSEGWFEEIGSSSITINFTDGTSSVLYFHNRSTALYSMTKSKKEITLTTTPVIYDYHSAKWFFRCEKEITSIKITFECTHNADEVTDECADAILIDKLGCYDEDSFAAVSEISDLIQAISASHAYVQLSNKISVKSQSADDEDTYLDVELNIPAFKAYIQGHTFSTTAQTLPIAISESTAPYIYCSVTTDINGDIDTVNFAAYNSADKNSVTELPEGGYQIEWLLGTGYYWYEPGPDGTPGSSSNFELSCNDTTIIFGGTAGDNPFLRDLKTESKISVVSAVNEVKSAADSVSLKAEELDDKISANTSRIDVIDSTLAILKDNLGTMSDMLDLLNGVTEEST